MRLGYVAPFDLLEPSGHVAHVLGALRQLVRQVERVTLLAASCPPELREQLDFVAVPVLKLRGLHSASFGASCALALGPLLLRRRLDLLYARYFKSLSLPLGVARAAGIPTVVEVNSSLVNERRTARQGGLGLALEEWEERAIFRGAAGVVSVTRAIDAELRERHPAARWPSAVVENGVDVELYKPLERQSSRRELGLRADGEYLIFAGAFQVWQGLPDLVRALALARERRPGLELLVVGDGPERATLERSIAALGLGNAVHLCGFQREAQVVKYIAAADVCVAAYNTEAVEEGELDKRRYGARMRGSPLKVATYMACGRSVVTTHLAEAGAYLQERGLGVAVPPEEPQALADAIVALLADRERAQAMAGRALETARRELSWEAAVASALRLAERARRDWR